MKAVVAIALAWRRALQRRIGAHVLIALRLRWGDGRAVATALCELHLVEFELGLVLGVVDDIRNAERMIRRIEVRVDLEQGLVREAERGQLRVHAFHTAHPEHLLLLELLQLLLSKTT